MAKDQKADEAIPLTNKDKLHWVFVAIGVVILLLIVLGGLLTTKIPKRKLVSVYGVDKKTFNKWLEHFCSDLVPDLEAYKRKRAVSILCYLRLTTRLGDPKKYPILSKKEIISMAEGTYYTLRGCVENYTQQYGLPSVEAYLSLKKFPPNISQKMLELYC